MIIFFREEIIYNYEIEDCTEEWIGSRLTQKKEQNYESHIYIKADECENAV